MKRCEAGIPKNMIIPIRLLSIQKTGPCAMRATHRSEKTATYPVYPQWLPSGYLT